MTHNKDNHFTAIAENFLNQAQKNKDKFKNAIEDQTKIPFENLVSLAELSKDNDLFQIFRPINADALEHLTQNDAAGKGLEVKGKSAFLSASEESASELAWIMNAKIPVNQAFSKCGTDDNIEKIRDYNEKNSKILKESEERVASLREKISNSKAVITEEELEGIVTAKTLRDSQYREIYAIIEPKGDVNLAAKDNHGAMIFVTRNESGNLQRITQEGKAQDSTNYTLKEGQEIEPVKALYYRRFKVQNLDNGMRDLQEFSSQLIVPDLDPLVIGGKSPCVSSEEIINSNQDPRSPVNMGNYFAHAVTAAHKEDHKRNNLISHGSEVYNPFPEPFYDGIHICVIPTGNPERQLQKGPEPQDKDLMASRLGYRNDVDIVAARGELGVLDCYNYALGKGYNMMANPGWGWMVNEENKLEIDPTRGLAQDRYYYLSEIMTQHGEKSPQYKDASNLNKIMDEINIEQLKPYDPLLKRYISGRKEEMYALEEKFFEDHGIDSPTFVARQKETARKADNNNVKTVESVSIKLLLECLKSASYTPPFARGPRKTPLHASKYNKSASHLSAKYGGRGL